MSRSTDFTAAVTDRDAVIAVAGAGKRELLGKPVSDQLEKLMTERSVYHFGGMGAMPPVCQDNANFTAAVAAPVLCEGDVLECGAVRHRSGAVWPVIPSASWPRPWPLFWAKTWRTEKTGPLGRSCFLR
ncbi:MAG: stage V sporulation T C-terminal domain-containing protein [Oscillospiraceae bacterium]